MKILPLGQPDPVRNCSIETLHNLNIKIQCISGTSGGLEQQFLLKVISTFYAAMHANPPT